MKLSMMYRGFLTSCNYGCSYCPFAKRTESESRSKLDQDSLTRFVEWVEKESTHEMNVLFTPWGEALVRAWYREAMIRISRFDHVRTVAAQTNLSCDLEWIKRCRIDRFSLWCTFHPTEVVRTNFMNRVRKLREMGVRLSVGVVAVPDSFDVISSLREELPPDVYLWINAQQPRKREYSTAEIASLTAIDPQFPRSIHAAHSLDRWCQAGETSFTVDGNGDMRRCHFVEEPIGNIHDAQWESVLRARRCPNRLCRCYLGKSQLEIGTSLSDDITTDALLRLSSQSESHLPNR